MGDGGGLAVYAQGWVSVVGEQAEVRFCLFFECGEEELERRLLDRGKTSGRDDDNSEVEHGHRRRTHAALPRALLRVCGRGVDGRMGDLIRASGYWCVGLCVCVNERGSR